MDGSIALKNVHVAVGGAWILKNLSFSVEQGEFLGIIGPNGSGKTTLMRLLLGMLKPQVGSVEIDRNVHIGYVPQSRQMDPETPLNVTDFVRLGLPHWFRPWETSKDRNAVKEALRLTQCLDLADKPIGKLSGGQRQRIYLTQAIIKNPKVLLLDEPTSNLDPGAQEQIMAVVNQIRRERRTTVIFVSHDVNLVARYADQILYMTKGAYAVGKVDEVMQPNILSNLYGMPVDVMRSGSNLIVSMQNSMGPATSICVHHT